jgi:hypothetical protein
LLSTCTRKIVHIAVNLIEPLRSISHMLGICLASIEKKRNARSFVGVTALRSVSVVAVSCNDPMFEKKIYDFLCRSSLGNLLALVLSVPT